MAWMQPRLCQETSVLLMPGATPSIGLQVPQESG